MTLTIVAVVVTSVLRATRAPMRGHLRPAGFGTARDGILSQDVFDGALSDLCERARWRSELVGVIAVRIDDLEQISTAFGSEVARAVTETWRTGVRRHAPSNALRRRGRPERASRRGARRTRPARRAAQAGVIYRGLFDDLGMVGVGGTSGSDPRRRGRRGAQRHDAATTPRPSSSVARDAASRAATNVETSVLVGEAE